LTQHSSIFDLCCADDTLFGVSLLSESWDAWEGVGERSLGVTEQCESVMQTLLDSLINSTAPRFPAGLFFS